MNRDGRGALRARSLRIAVLPALLGVAFGCGQPDADRPTEIEGPSRLTAVDRAVLVHVNALTLHGPTVAWMPGGRQLAVSYRVEGGGGPPVLALVDVESGARSELGQGSRPAPSPDGRRIAFSGAGGDLMVIDTDASAPRKLAGTRGMTVLPIGDELSNFGHSLYAWSPGGETLAYRHVSFRFGFLPRYQLRTVELADGRVRTLLKAAFLDGINWVDDDRIVVAIDRSTDELADLIEISATSGGQRTIATDVGALSLIVAPRVAPDGKTIAILSDPGARPQTPDFWSPAVVPTAGGSPRRVAADLFITGVVSNGPEWTPDGTALVVGCKTGAVDSQLCRIGVDGSLKLWRPDAVADIQTWSLAPDGQRVAWWSRDANGVRSLRVAAFGSASSAVLIELPPEAAPAVPAVRTEEIWWQAPDGLRIAGLLISPPDAAPPFPTVVDIHGGPQGGVELSGALFNFSPLEWRIWTSRGHAVFVPDYRSSRVYGNDKAAARFDTKGTLESKEPDAEDILAGVDHLVSAGIADPDRLILIGHSHGAFLANWILTRTDRFRVAVSKEGGGDDQITAAFASVRTPTLLVSAGKWPGVKQMDELARILEARGVASRRLHFPDDSHVLMKGENRERLLEETLAWTEAHASQN